VEVPLLVDDFLRRASTVYADKTAVVDGDLRLTYRELQARVDQLSRALLAAGIEPGDRVCILSPNSHFFLESFYATAQVGIILVPLNYRLVAADHEYILNHAGVRAVLVDWEYTKVVDEIRPQLTQVEHWIVAKNGLPHEGETPEGIKQNQRVQVRAIFDQRSDVVKVQRGPFLEAGAGRLAYSIEDGIAVLRPIEVGAISVSEVEIAAGLEVGDQIIISDTERFKGAEKVLIRD